MFTCHVYLVVENIERELYDFFWNRHGKWIGEKSLMYIQCSRLATLQHGTYIRMMFRVSTTTTSMQGTLEHFFSKSFCIPSFQMLLLKSMLHNRSLAVTMSENQLHVVVTLKVLLQTLVPYPRLEDV